MPRKATDPVWPPDTTDIPVTWVPLDTVRPHPRNDGTHPPDELAHLKQSLQEHGIYRNVVLADDGTILAGHGVVEAARQLGHTQMLARRMPYGPDDPQALKILVGDNHIARLRMQDDAALVALLEELRRDDPLALLGTGFDEAALAALVAQQETLGGNGTGGEEAGRDAEPQIDRAEELKKVYGVEVGQLWALGEHQVICGDCTDKAVVERLLNGRDVRLVLTDPPYGIDLDTAGLSLPGGWDGSQARAPKARLRRYQKILGDTYPFDPVPLLDFFHACPEVFLWGGNYFAERLPQGAWFVWDKTGGGLVQTLGHEFEVCWSKHGHRGQVLRYRWAGVHGMESEDTETRVHPAQKPVALVSWFIEHYSVRYAVVADLYVGSGTTLIACENLHRVCYGCEIDPGYVAVTLQRWADVTGQQPQLLA